MAITSTDVINVAPELSSVATSRIDDFIAFAKPYINFPLWDDKADFAHSLFTAHLLTLSNNTGSATTNVKSEKVGDLSRSFEGPKSDELLSSTSYGSMFLSLRRSLLISPIVIKC